MPIRAYILYFSGAAAANCAQIQVVKSCEILNVNYSLYAAVNNGVAAEISIMAARQYGTNNTQGILAMAVISSAAASTAQLHANHFVPIPPGCRLNNGDFVYLHTTGLGGAGTAQTCVTLYVRE